LRGDEAEDSRDTRIVADVRVWFWTWRARDCLMDQGA
jgi:hypothetical protein